VAVEKAGILVVDKLINCDFERSILLQDEKSISRPEYLPSAICNAAAGFTENLRCRKKSQACKLYTPVAARRIQFSSNNSQ